MAIQTLFTTIAEIQEYITVDIGSNTRTILPYIKQAEKYTTEIIGRTLHQKLLEVAQGTSSVQKYVDLLDKVRLPLANFGYMLAIAKLNVNVGEKGFTVTETQNLAPASQWRVDAFKEAVELSGNDGLEQLIIYLEENVKYYPEWKQSRAYSYNKQFFINNAEEFNTTVKNDITRIKFLKLKPFIHIIEQAEIKKAISRAFFDELKKQILNNNVSNKNKTLLNEYIRPCVCYLAYDKLHESGLEFAKLEGTRYLEEMRNHLDENPDDYPIYKTSSCYVDPTSFKTEINNEDSGLFVGGCF